MEGRAIARPNPPQPSEWAPGSSDLQWRAGQLPGQTRRGERAAFVRGAASSMEGRAIARPNLSGTRYSRSRIWSLQWRAGQLPGQTHDTPHRKDHRNPLFNGGPGNCPAKPVWLPGHVRDRDELFNGGPGNCPAKPRLPRRRPRGPRCSSMEGRAIARPNVVRYMAALQKVIGLQWRAGQLPGQTLPRQVGAGPQHEASMEGRAIARPNQELRSVTRHMAQFRASMEGRAIARPNRAGHQPHVPDPPRFNGGPGNCPAKLRWPTPITAP